MTTRHGARTSAIHPPAARTRKAAVLIYSIVVLGVLLMIGSLAVDYGRVQLAKTELQGGADAASRAGAAALTSGATAAEDAAIAAAAMNSCDGLPLVLNRATDIEIGWYDTATDTFSVLSGAARDSGNAVRVTARRTAATGSPIPLSLTKLYGKSSTDVLASSTALVSGGVGGYIGLSLTRMFNTTRFDNYSSAFGPYGGSNISSTGVLIGINDMSLNDQAYIFGKGQYGPTGTLNQDVDVTVNPGPVSRLAATYTFPPVSLGSIATSNDNASITQYRSGTSFDMGDNKGSVTFPGGDYYFTKFDVGKNDTVLFTGTTTIWLNGDSQILGTVAHTSYMPASLRFQVAGGRHVKIQDYGKVYASIYAPQSDVHHHEYGQTFGSVISDLLCFRHNAQGHYDQSSAAVSGGAGNATLKQVR